MSRSRKKTNAGGCTTAPSERDDKNIWHTTTKRTRKGVDELNLNVVAQGNVTMINKSKATFRLPTVRFRRKNKTKTMECQP